MTAWRPQLGVLAATSLACAPHVVQLEPEAPAVAGVFPSAPDGAPAQIAEVWWTGIADASLDTLLRDALAQNPSVVEAAARLRGARAIAEAAGAVRLPELGVSATGGLEHPRGPGAAEVSGAVAWEVDLFGRLASRAYAAEEDAAAAFADLEAVRLLLTAEAADVWFRGVEQRQQLELLQRQRELSRTLLELTELRFAQGAASAVDVLQQRAQLAGIDARIPRVRAELHRTENRLDVLLGSAPDGTGRLPAEPGYPALPDAVAIGVPAELLVRRPDLRALRNLLVAADHRIAAAIAERLPRFTITGAFGYSAAGETSGVIASLLGSAFAPLIDFGARAAAVDQSRAVFDEVLAAFTGAYLEAIAEVDGALHEEARKREETALVERRVEALEATVEEARNRYANGLSDYLPVLTAVEELHDTQRELLVLRREIVSLRIALHRALGGGLPAGEERS